MIATKDTDPIRSLLVDCNNLIQTPPLASTGKAGNFDPRWTACEQVGSVRSVTSDFTLKVTFHDRSDGCRSVMWIDFLGNPVESANLDPGEIFTIETYLTHPWMSQTNRVIVLRCSCRLLAHQILPIRHRGVILVRNRLSNNGTFESDIENLFDFVSKYEFADNKSNNLCIEF